ncbi:MAG: SUMF1/EgtB/PvdO family nonheme iron enzyme [Patescibacteria group bacterium]|nr:SUMF1/EgtB/PvdO family nonheme iron enzyme [Patescibacteria group bacterium]
MTSAPDASPAKTTEEPAESEEAAQEEVALPPLPMEPAVPETVGPTATEIMTEPGETVQQPKAEEPKVEEPKAEEPKMEEPKAEEPKAEEPKAEEPKAEEPKVEEPKAEEPKAEEPKMDEPKAEESAKSQAAEGEPVDYIKVPTPAWMPEPVEVENAAAASQDEMKTYTEVISDTTVTFDMVPIPGGKFKLGSPDSEEGRNDDEGPQVEVEIEPFWMGKHEVTWDEYELWGLGLDKQRREMTNVTRTDRHELIDAVAIPTKPYTDMTFGMGKDGFPAICMTQTAAKMYCKWLSAKTGRYYRLPTEAEWEYACRAGSDAAYSFGDDAEKLGDYAWYYDNSNEKYQKIGLKKANAWGLHDMHGNVAEWVLDQHTPDFYATLKEKPSPVKNALADATKLYPRVVRGGSWDDDAKDVRSAVRRGSTTDWMMQDPQIPQSPWYHTDADFLGFRVVRPLRVPTPEEAKRYELDEIQITELEEYREAQAGKM